MFNVKNINIGKVKRSLRFPYKVIQVGNMDCNPALKNVEKVFPDKLEINIRLNGSEDAVMVLGGSEYICKSPHVVVKKPNSRYEFRKLPERDVFYICYETDTMFEFDKIGLFDGALAWEIERTFEVEFLLKKICDAMNRSREAGVADSLDLDCFSLINQLLWQRENHKNATVNAERELIMQADSFLHVNVMKQVDFEELAKNIGMSKSTFFRHWKKYFNDTPATHFRNLKLDEAMRLLSLHRYKVYEVAEMLQFSSSAYFCAVFCKHFGMTPQQYVCNLDNNKEDEL